LTGWIRQQRATIDLGMTPVLPNYSRIPSLTSADGKRATNVACKNGTGDKNALGSDRGELAAFQRQDEE
jgi:hypothetical protein